MANEYPKVYLYDDVGNISKGTELFLEKIAEDFISEGVGFKIHFGDERNDTHIRSEWLSKLPNYFKKPTFIECNVLYRGARTTGKNHLNVANEHGFGFIDVDILDGELGEDSLEVPIDIGNTTIAKLGKGIERYERIVALSHFTGHMATSFGGALKNIGMGLGSREGKMDMHSIVSPYVKTDKCTACGTCAENCDFGAIEIAKTAIIDSDRCVGCARCIAVCPVGAIDIPWDMSTNVNQRLMEKIAEYALAVNKGRQLVYVNFLTDVTHDCDCLPFRQKPFIEDIGIVMSKDPVAVDRASLDLIMEKYGKDPFLEKHGIDGDYILSYAESIGLGSREYNIITDLG